ncbi:hypothetical protein TIFTF001_005014 [Ficus carica]|uniref:Uncharacterized protein n=1 Tax=Ficus carica TaxID=3494 RepID=A0AA87ZJA5_FICCA|nr:hypothetical protein TIFTF001_005014 [Ficus carica]
MICRQCFRSNAKEIGFVKIFCPLCKDQNEGKVPYATPIA